MPGGEMSTHFEREIHEQPDHLRRLLTRRAEVEALARTIRAFAPRFVVTAARGSSGNAARYAKYLLGAHNHLVVSLGAPSLLTLYESPPDLRGALVLGLSQSGQSPDVTALMLEARAQGALTVAITNAPDSPMARAAQHAIALDVGPEQAIPASKSYTAQLTVLAMLSAALADSGARWDALAALPAAAQRTLEMNPMYSMSAILRPLVTATRAFIVGRGFNLCTAFEVALKLKELSYLSVEAFATPEFLHGPIAMVDFDVPGILVAPRGPTLPDLVALLAELERRGAPVLVISNGDPAVTRFESARAEVLTFSDAVGEWLSPILSVLPGQLAACAVSLARGHDPDRPRGLAKITRTR